MLFFSSTQWTCMHCFSQLIPTFTHSMLNFIFILSTFVCPTEIVSFSDRVEEFRTIGCEVIGASTDSEFSHLAWINTPRKQGKID